MKYSDWFLDPRWQKKRLEVLERDNWTCQLCGYQFEQNAEHVQKPLDVHHLRYVRGRKPFEYENEDLVTLCRPCHSVQDRRGGLTSVGAIIPGVLADMVAPSVRTKRHSEQWQAILRKFGVREERYDARVCIVCWAAWRADGDLTRCGDCRREGAA
jgi:hypothetical protein